MKKIFFPILLCFAFVFSFAQSDFSEGYEKSDSSVFVTLSILEDSTAAVRGDFPSGGGGGGCTVSYSTPVFSINTSFFNFYEPPANETPNCHIIRVLNSSNSQGNGTPHVLNVDVNDGWTDGDRIEFHAFGSTAQAYGFRFINGVGTDIIHPDGTNGSTGDLGGEPAYTQNLADSNDKLIFLKMGDKWVVQD